MTSESAQRVSLTGCGPHRSARPLDSTRAPSRTNKTTRDFSDKLPQLHQQPRWEPPRPAAHRPHAQLNTAHTCDNRDPSPELCPFL